MTVKLDIAPASDRELVLARIIEAPREKVWRCWTDPEILPRWFTPKPWTTARAELDLRPGGSCLIVMADPDGNEYPNPGVYLEVVPGQKLVSTSAYTSAWEPAEISDVPLFTCVLTFEDEGPGQTRYIARVKHWDVAGREKHEKMGFHEGWGICADQLEATAGSL